MAKRSKAKQSGTPTESDGLVVHWTRLSPEDSAELRRREEMTGASVSAQIRIIIHNALTAKGKVR